MLLRDYRKLAAGMQLCSCLFMFRKKEIDISALLDRPLWQLSCREYIALLRYAQETHTESGAPATRHLCHGVDALAQYLGCSPAKIYELKRKGILDAAVVSHIGRAIVFDGDRARELANANQVK